MSSDLLKAVGGRIRSLREAKGVSQEAFAKTVGMDRAYIGRVERGEQNISIITAARLTGALGVDLATLFEGAPKIDRQSVEQ
jgi:transcriptional regulator with XRE-family HTH domain